VSATLEGLPGRRIGSLAEVEAVDREARQLAQALLARI
jgi:hypothetical protein